MLRHTIRNFKPTQYLEKQKYYDVKAKDLAEKFVKNFEKFSDHAGEEILAPAPRII